MISKFNDAMPKKIFYSVDEVEGHPSNAKQF